MFFLRTTILFSIELLVILPQGNGVVIPLFLKDSKKPQRVLYDFPSQVPDSDKGKIASLFEVYAYLEKEFSFVILIEESITGSCIKLSQIMDHLLLFYVTNEESIFEQIALFIRLYYLMNFTSG